MGYLGYLKLPRASRCRRHAAAGRALRRGPSAPGRARRAKPNPVGSGPIARDTLGSNTLGLTSLQFRSNNRAERPPPGLWKRATPPPGQSTICGRRLFPVYCLARFQTPSLAHTMPPRLPHRALIHGPPRRFSPLVLLLPRCSGGALPVGGVCVWARSDVGVPPRARLEGGDKNRRRRRNKGSGSCIGGAGRNDGGLHLGTPALRSCCRSCPACGRVHRHRAAQGGLLRVWRRHRHYCGKCAGRQCSCRALRCDPECSK